MTAIFLVWNTSGFAVAADQNVSLTEVDEAGKQNTLWLETEQKLHILEDKKIVVAISGNLSMNGITFNSIVKKWSDQLNIRYPHLTDYALDFLNWIKDSKLHFHSSGGFDTDKRIERLLITIKLKCDENPNLSPLDATEELISVWKRTENQNIYSPNVWENMGVSVQNDVLTNHFYEAAQSFLRERTAFREYEEQIKLKLQKQMENQFDNCSQSELKLMQNLLVEYIARYIDSEETEETRVLFVGYGDDQWTPTSVLLSVYPYDLSVPKINCIEVKSPHEIWVQTMARDAEFFGYIHGLNFDVSKSIKEGLLAYFEENNLDIDYREEISPILDHPQNVRVSNMRNKINSLSLTKLEFLAKQFVQLESLSSFLLENLPSVGGNIDSVSMSR